MKKILAEIKAQFESVKGQPPLEEILAKDQEWHEFCQRLRREAAAERKLRELQKSKESSVESFIFSNQDKPQTDAPEKSTSTAGYKT